MIGLTHLVQPCKGSRSISFKKSIYFLLAFPVQVVPVRCLQRVRSLEAKRFDQCCLLYCFFDIAAADVIRLDKLQMHNVISGRVQRRQCES